MPQSTQADSQDRPYQNPRVQARLLDDGRRLHLNDGPIDLIIEAFGQSAEVRAAYGQAHTRFQTILDELCRELPALRRPHTLGFHGATAQRMSEAIAAFPLEFITPMAAVAGAVADEMLAALTKGRKLTRAYVNNGGDTAFYLAPHQSITVAVPPSARVKVSQNMPSRGIATSGWQGRSQSLGIADAVTVLAKDAATADAAATLIANAVDTYEPRIKRAPANSLYPDSDLGARPVTTYVPILAPAQVQDALANGLSRANALVTAGRISAAHLTLQSKTMTTNQPLA